MARWGESVQHFGCAGVCMDRPARLYLCARCRVQVILCSRCDRGNRYCGRQCRYQAGEQARRETAQRYQRSRQGRLAHAQRSRRWRQRRAARDAAVGAGVDAQNVTHQGCRPGAGSAPLATWTHDTLSVEAGTPTQGTLAHGAAQGPAMVGRCWVCRRCGLGQPAALRLGYLRHGLPTRRRHDHSP